MAEKLDRGQVATFDELLRATMFETEATRRVLVRKDLLANEEVLEEVKAVRQELSMEVEGEWLVETGSARLRTRFIRLCLIR